MTKDELVEQLIRDLKDTINEFKGVSLMCEKFAGCLLDDLYEYEAGLVLLPENKTSVPTEVLNYTQEYLCKVPEKKVVIFGTRTKEKQNRFGTCKGLIKK